MVAAAVLAGGASRRMGRDKATMPVGGVQLAARALHAAAQVADPVVLVAPEGHPSRRLTAAGLVADPGEGPLAAVAAAFAALDAEHVLVLAGDHPGLRVELLEHLLALRGRGEAVACRRGDRLEPMVAVYRRAPALAAAKARLAGAAAGRSLHGLLGALRTVIVEESEWRALDPDGRSFVDLDDPADLAAWEAGPERPR
jgi:molybdenum cofactor guanylyltransferase